MRKPIDAAPFKDYLRNLKQHMQFADDLVCVFASLLADYIGPKLTPQTLLTESQRLLDDLKTGVNSITKENLNDRLVYRCKESLYHVVISRMVIHFVDAACSKSFAGEFRKLREHANSQSPAK